MGDTFNFVRKWWSEVSRFIWRLRNARYQQRRAMDVEQDERHAAHLKRTADGAGDRPMGPMGPEF